MLSPTVLLDRTHRRRCLVRSTDSTTTVCGRPLNPDTSGIGRAGVVNCPDCHAAAAFVMDRQYL